MAPWLPGVDRTAARWALAVACFGVLLAALAVPAGAQAPHADWRTLDLPHFRVHYPAPADAWARRVAGRLEAARALLVAEIGYAPEQTIEVVVADPVAQPNGQALPFLAAPRMVLWVSAPEPSSLLGVYRDWGELVAVHEDAHLVHLLRPSRNPWNRLTARLLPGGGVGPITTRAPRWAIEGYATVLEGRFTGSGRPNGDLRAAVLRQRARSGRLPSYGALAGDDQSWLGGSMAYLAGSAFLEWLEARGAPPPAGASGDARENPLRDVWARLSARRARSFDEAFAGVFGAPPAELYGRFAAEVTWRAIEAERRLTGTGAGAAWEAPDGLAGSPGARLWQDLSWATGAPAVSPDGERLAAIVRSRDVPPRLVVWTTAVDEEAVAQREEERERIRAADPEDVAAVPPRTSPHAIVAELPTIDGRAPLEARWSADGESLLFVASAPDAEGFLRPDLYRWQPGEGGVERITRSTSDPGEGHGGLRSPDPLPTAAPAGSGSERAVAVESRWGLSRLVLVDLASGAVAPLTEASLDTLWATPRVSPDGRRLAALRHRDGRWRLVVASLEAGPPEAGPRLGPLVELEIETAGEADGPPARPERGERVLADPAWAPDGETLYLALGTGGFVDLWALDLGTPSTGSKAVEAPARRLTRVLGAAFAPAPAPDGESLYFLSLEADGLDLARLELARVAPDGTGGLAAAAGAVDAGAVPADVFSAEGEAVLDPLLAPAVTPSPSLPRLPADPTAEGRLAGVEGRSYGVGPQHLVPLAGIAAGPSGRALEAGVATGDPVGRLDAFLLGTVGEAGMGEGGALAVAWRGWPVEVTGQAYLLRRKPSRQDSPSGVAASGLFDRELRGVAIGAGWARRPAAALSVRLGLDIHAGEVEALAPGAGGSEETRGALVSGAFAWAPSRGRWSLPGLGRGWWQEGETGGAPWSRWGLGADLGVALSGAGDSQGFRLAWERHGTALEGAGGAAAGALGGERFAVGGLRRSVLPWAADSARIPVPALPAATLVGGEHEMQRVELLLAGEELPIFWERHRVWDVGADEGEWLELAGIELRFDLPPTPLVGLPALHATAGAAYLLDGPLPESLRDEIRAWVSLVWRP